MLACGHRLVIITMMSLKSNGPINSRSAAAAAASSWADNVNTQLSSKSHYSRKQRADWAPSRRLLWLPTAKTSSRRPNKCRSSWKPITLRSQSQSSSLKYWRLPMGRGPWRLQITMSNQNSLTLNRPSWTIRSPKYNLRKLCSKLSKTPDRKRLSRVKMSMTMRRSRIGCQSSEWKNDASGLEKLSWIVPWSARGRLIKIWSLISWSSRRGKSLKKCQKIRGRI